MPFPNVSGLRIGEVTKFEFSPSLAIIARDVDKLGLDIRSFREPLRRAVQQVMIPSFQKNFDVGGRPAWEPLSDATLEMRRRGLHKGKGGTKPLDLTGTLKRNMSYMSIWTFTSDYAAITDLPQRIWYGKAQQAGFRTFFITAPARPFVIMQPEDEEAVARVFDTYIAERLAARGWV